MRAGRRAEGGAAHVADRAPVGRSAPFRRGRSRDPDEYETWLEAVLERSDPVMAWLGVVFALFVGYEIAVDLGRSAATVLTVAGWCIWAIFAIEFAAHVYVAPARWTYVRNHWFQVLALALPTLRLFRFLRLLRLGRALPAARVVTSSYRAAGTARKLLGTRLGYLGAVTAVVAIAIAELAFLFERGVPEGAYDSFGDAVLWSVGVIVAQQGDPVPQSLGAHLVMLAGFGWGVVVFATVAGSLGAFFVEHRGDQRAAGGVEPGPQAPEGS